MYSKKGVVYKLQAGWFINRTPGGVINCGLSIKFKGLLCGTPTERGESLKLNFWPPSSSLIQPRHLDCLPQARGFRTGKNTIHQAVTLPMKPSKNTHRIAKHILRQCRSLSQRSCRVLRDRRQLSLGSQSTQKVRKAAREMSLSPMCALIPSEETRSSGKTTSRPHFAVYGEPLSASSKSALKSNIEENLHSTSCM